MLALGQAGLGAGRGLRRVDDFLVAKRRDNFLLNEHLAARLAVLALGQASLGASCCLRRVDDFLVAERRDVIVHIAVAAGTGVRRIALFRAGRGRDDRGIGVLVRGLRDFCNLDHGHSRVVGEVVARDGVGLARVKLIAELRELLCRLGHVELNGGVAVDIGVFERHGGLEHGLVAADELDRLHVLVALGAVVDFHIHGDALFDDAVFTDVDGLGLTVYIAVSAHVDAVAVKVFRDVVSDRAVAGRADGERAVRAAGGVAVAVRADHFLGGNVDELELKQELLLGQGGILELLGHAVGAVGVGRGEAQVIGLAGGEEHHARRDRAGDAGLIFGDCVAVAANDRLHAVDEHLPALGDVVFIVDKLPRDLELRAGRHLEARVGKAERHADVAHGDDRGGGVFCTADGALTVRPLVGFGLLFAAVAAAAVRLVVIGRPSTEAVLVGLFGAARELPCEHGEAALGVGCKRSAERRGKGGVFQLRLGLGNAGLDHVRCRGRVEEVAVLHQPGGSAGAHVVRLVRQRSDVEAVFQLAAVGDDTAEHHCGHAAAVDAVFHDALIVGDQRRGGRTTQRADSLVDAGINHAVALVPGAQHGVKARGCRGAGDAAGDLHVFDRAVIVAEHGHIALAGLDGEGDRVALAVKRALKGLVVRRAADGTPFFAGGIDVGGQDDGLVLIEFFAVGDIRSECLQLGERADLQIRLVFGERRADRHCAQAQDQGQHKQP